MGRPKGSGKKSPYEDLPEEWKNTISGKKYEELDQELARVAKSEDDNRKAKADDVDLENRRLEYREAGAAYREASKMHKLKTSFIIEVQAAKGRPVQKG